MIEAEVAKVVEQVCGAFPSVRDLVEKNPTVIKAWARTLDCITYDEGMKVLDDWITGKIENAPTGFERERVALNMRAYALGDRSRENARIARDQVSQDAAAKKFYRNTRSAAYVHCAPVLAEIQVLSQQYNNGQITMEERDIHTTEILHRAYAEIDKRADDYNASEFNAIAWSKHKPLGAKT